MRLRNYLKYTNRIIKVVTEISLKKKKKWRYPYEDYGEGIIYLCDEQRRRPK